MGHLDGRVGFWRSVVAERGQSRLVAARSTGGRGAWESGCAYPVHSHPGQTFAFMCTQTAVVNNIYQSTEWGPIMN